MKNRKNLKFVDFNNFLKFVKIRWTIFRGCGYIDNGVYQKTHKQQQNVMLRGTGHSKIEEKTGKRQSLERWVTWVHANIDKLFTE